MMENGKNSLAAQILAISLVAVLVLIGTAMGEVSRSGLVAEYHFDGDAKDSSGNGNDGTVYGAAFVGGISGNALRFDGNNDYINIPDSPSLNIIGSMTIEAWIQFKEGNMIQSIISKSSIPQTNSFVFPRFDKTNQLTFWLNNGSSWQTLYVGNVIPYMEWHHVAGTYDGSYMKIYVDGTLAGTLPVSGAITTNTNPLTIGYQPGTPEYFSGIIDEVRIYNRDLTEDEIKTSYKSFMTLTPPKLLLTKSISPSTINEKDTATFTIRVENTGGDARNVKITDTIPEGFNFVSGTMTQEYIILNPSESRTFQYILKAMNAGRFVSDPASVTYRDDKDNSYSSASNSATITVKGSQPQEAPRLSGFSALLAGICIVFAMALRRR